MEITWTDRKDNGCPLFGTFLGKDKIEDNFPVQHLINSEYYGCSIGKIINVVGAKTEPLILFIKL